eukprot:m.55989 g.55989  ORF g.55989 m.55989 type:complete len:654 (-) comp13674_c0_seq2:978-2939(-)
MESKHVRPKRISNVKARVKKLATAVVEPPSKASAPQWQSLDVLSMDAPSTTNVVSAESSNRSSISTVMACPSCDITMDQSTHKCMALHPCSHVMCRSCSRSKTDSRGAIVCGLCNCLVEAVVVATMADQEASLDLPIRASHTISATPVAGPEPSISVSSSPERTSPQTGSLAAPKETAKLQVLASRKYAKHKAGCRSLEKRTGELLTRLAQLEMSFNSKNDTGAEIKAQIDDVDRDMERLLAKKARLTTRYEQHQTDQMALAAIIDSAKEELALLKKDYTKSVKQLDTVKAQLQSYGCYDEAVRDHNRSASSSWSSISSISTTHSSSATLSHAETRALASPLLSREGSNNTVSPPAQPRRSLSRGTLIGKADALPAAPLPPDSSRLRVKKGSTAGTTPPRPASQLVSSVTSKSTRSQHRRSVYVEAANPSAAPALPSPALPPPSKSLPAARDSVVSQSSTASSRVPSTTQPSTSASRTASTNQLSRPALEALERTPPARKGVRVIMDESDDESSADDGVDDDYEELGDIMLGDESMERPAHSILEQMKTPGLERQDSALLQKAIGHNMAKSVQRARSQEALSLDVTLNASAIEQLYSEASSDEGEERDEITMSAVNLALAAAAHMENSNDDAPEMGLADEEMLLSFAGKGTIC